MHFFESLNGLALLAVAIVALCGFLLHQRGNARTQSIGAFMQMAAVLGALTLVMMQQHEANGKVAQTWSTLEKIRLHEMKNYEEPGGCDLMVEAHRAAVEESGQFVNEHLWRVRSFPDRFQLLANSMTLVDPKLKGLYCEFGVMEGESINFLAKHTSAMIHGFDSFEGLPETWVGGAKRAMDLGGKLPKVEPNVQLHKGWFDKTLPVWKEGNPGPIAFMHVDSDLYSSAKCIFDVLGERIVPGTIIQFDDYLYLPGWKQLEHKAFTEFVEARKIRFEYTGFNRRGSQLAVKILEVGSSQGR